MELGVDIDKYIHPERVKVVLGHRRGISFGVFVIEAVTQFDFPQSRNIQQYNYILG